MDELTLLRKVRSDADGPTVDAIAKGRSALLEQALLEEMGRAEGSRGGRLGRRRPAKHPRLRRAGLVSGGGVVAAGIVTALVFGNVVGLAGWRGGADAAAAATLDEAAAAAIHTSDPVVGPGQYLEVATHAAYSSTTVSKNGESATFIASQDGQMYVPQDRSGVWTWIRDPSVPVKTFGPASAKAAAAETVEPGPEVLNAKAGAFYGSPAIVTAEGLNALPRDPHQLLNYIYRTTLGAGPSPDGEALVWIADTLRSGIVPADIRATFYRAAAMIPGVTVTDKNANLDGRTGVAIGRDENDGIRQEILVDPTTGLVIGEREVLTRASGELPVGTAIGWTAVTTTVVDVAPAK